MTSTCETYELTYVNAGDGLCAIHVKTDNNSGELYYVYKDYLGSILKLTNSDLTEEYEQSFDAWGRYRDPDTWEVYNSNPSEGGVFDPDVIGMPEWFNRGYTGHEHLREFDLVNMNGRFYDPIPGRMLSADNHVQEPGYSQSYNRYAYAFNNPLKYTDPSGEIGILAIVGAAVGMAVASYFINAERNDWEWNPSKWNEGAVTFGANYNPTTGSTSLYGGGMIGNAGFTGGGNLQTGNWGGGFSPFGQAGYNEMPAAGTGSIDWRHVDNQQRWDNRPDKSLAYAFASYAPSTTPRGNPESGGLSTNYALSNSWNAFRAIGKKGYTAVNNEFRRQVSFNNSLKKTYRPGVELDDVTSLNVPKSVRFVAKYTGPVFTAYSFYNVNEQWMDGRIGFQTMAIEQTSNFITFFPPFGTGWGVGWELGKEYGPSKWYGSNDRKWFE